MTRTLVLRGPAAIWYDSQVHYTEDDIVCDISIELSPVNTSMHGKVDDTALNIKLEISATPIGIWGTAGASFVAKTASLWPWLSATPGTAIFPATAAAEKTLVIKTLVDGAVYTFKSAAITKMPSLKLSTQKILCGSVTWTCLRALAAATHVVQAWTVAESLFATTAAAFTDNSFDTADVLRDSYTAIWTGVAGLTTATESLDGFAIDFGMDTTPESCDSLGVYDYTLKGVTCSAKFAPIGGPTIDQLITAMKIQSAGGARGMSMAGVQAATLVISGSAVGRPKITLNSAALISAPMAFGMDKKRIGELTFNANRIFTGGATGALAVIGVVTA